MSSLPSASSYRYVLHSGPPEGQGEEGKGVEGEMKGLQGLILALIMAMHAATLHPLEQLTSHYLHPTPL